MKISIIGTGRIGLSLGLSIAKAGHKVLFTDKDKKKLQLLSQGIFPFYEPQLKEVFQKVRQDCQFKNTLQDICSSQILFFTLNTPVNSKGDFDISGVLNWVKSICKHTTKEKILVLKSTFSPGTNQMVQEVIEKHKASVHALTCPEFLSQGEALKNILQPDRIVIGCRNLKIGKKLGQLYKTFSKGQLLYTTPETAELAKFACNAFLGLKVSFINEIAALLSCYQGEMKDLQKIMGTDHRINPYFLQPGLGFGGSCLPKDIKHLMYKGKEKKISTHILKAVLQTNEERGLHFFHQIKKYFKKLNGRTLVFWGLTFKKNTDDLSGSPALFLAKTLLSEGAFIRVYDPLIKNQTNTRHLFHKVFGKDSLPKKKQVIFCNSPKTSLKGGEALICGTEDTPQVSLKEIRKHLNFIVDGRGVFDKKELQKQGFVFYQAGSSFL